VFLIRKSFLLVNTFYNKMLQVAEDRPSVESEESVSIRDSDADRKGSRRIRGLQEGGDSEQKEVGEVQGLGPQGSSNPESTGPAGEPAGRVGGIRRV
jgi:hypothetical protein